VLLVISMLIDKSLGSVDIALAMINLVCWYVYALVQSGLILLLRLQF